MCARAGACMMSVCECVRESVCDCECVCVRKRVRA